MKKKTECEECGKKFEENGIYDLAKSINIHVESGECQSMKKNNESIACKKEDIE